MINYCTDMYWRYLYSGRSFFSRVSSKTTAAGRAASWWHPHGAWGWSLWITIPWRRDKPRCFSRDAPFVSAWTTRVPGFLWVPGMVIQVPSFQSVCKISQKKGKNMMLVKYGQMFCSWAHTTLPWRRTKLLHQVTLKPTDQHKNCHEYVSIKKLVGGMRPSETWHLALVIKARLCWIRASVAWFLGGDFFHLPLHHYGHDGLPNCRAHCPMTSLTFKWKSTARSWADLGETMGYSLWTALGFVPSDPSLIETMMFLSEVKVQKVLERSFWPTKFGSPLIRLFCGSLQCLHTH